MKYTNVIGIFYGKSLQWRHNERDGVSNHRHLDCLFNCVFRRRSKKTSKLRVTGPLWGEFTGDWWIPVQGASNAENVSIWWRHHVVDHGMWSKRLNTAIICWRKSHRLCTFYLLAIQLCLFSVAGAFFTHVNNGKFSNMFRIWYRLCVLIQWFHGDVSFNKTTRRTNVENRHYFLI